MTDDTAGIAYVRGDEAPLLPAPPNTVGVQGWLRTNLFSSVFYSILTILFGALLLWYIWDTIVWGLFNAVWTGTNREACVGAPDGACWPLVWDKFAQWIYGFYPIDQRWRVNICYFVGAAALVPMMMPSVPYKGWNALFLLVVYPLLALILLTGGNFGFSLETYGVVVALMLVAAALIPLGAFGAEDGIVAGRTGLLLMLAGILPWLIMLALFLVSVTIGILGMIVGWAGLTGLQAALVSGIAGLAWIETGMMAIPGLLYAVLALLAAGAAHGLYAVWASGDRGGRRAMAAWAMALAVLLAAMVLLDFDFGLIPVETTQWGGLLVTLVVSITAMVVSLPLGILLALGRRSEMPAVKLFSVVFIELWRGVPLITVLFMSSVMLPLFLPEGVNFDKLLRCLIGVALFTSAYMAEVVRSGLQAIPKGQYEGAMALGLSYWQMMGKVVLPQALKIAIPNIVGTFISVFKDTTLVSIIGLYDLLGIVRAGLKDPNWATPSSVPTGYFAVVLLFWIFCFGMSRYSIYTERRLATGHKR